ncbi:MAG: S16 family serine protease, partial [Acidimicrobiales bacterium]
NRGGLWWRAPTTMTATTSATPPDVVPSGCPGLSGPDRSWLGVSLENDVAYRLPAKVSINTANIGGPSAGLAMTLALINELSHGSLTGHHVVAATGTISVNGVVGDVGGVAEKTVAVQRAGAQYFLVPQVEVATARQAAAPGLTILGVTSLAEALHDLRALGGVKPEPITKVR